MQSLVYAGLAGMMYLPENRWEYSRRLHQFFAGESGVGRECRRALETLLAPLLTIRSSFSSKILRCLSKTVFLFICYYRSAVMFVKKNFSHPLSLSLHEPFLPSSKKNTVRKAGEGESRRGKLLFHLRLRHAARFSAAVFAQRGERRRPAGVRAARGGAPTRCFSWCGCSSLRCGPSGEIPAGAVAAQAWNFIQIGGLARIVAAGGAGGR